MKSEVRVGMVLDILIALYKRRQYKREGRHGIYIYTYPPVVCALAGQNCAFSISPGISDMLASP